MNIFHVIALNKVEELFGLFENALDPYFYLGLLDHIMHGDGDESALEGCEKFRYWLLCQKIIFSALLQLQKILAVTDKVSMDCLKEPLLVPRSDDYTCIMCSASDEALGIGVPGSMILQKQIYSFCGWDMQSIHYVPDDMYGEHYPLFFQFREMVPRKYWVRILRAVRDCIFEYQCDFYTVLFMRYPNIPTNDFRGSFANLFTACEFLHFEEANLFIYVIPSEIYGYYELDERQDLSSMNPYCVFHAIKKHLKEPVLLPGASS